LSLRDAWETRERRREGGKEEEGGDEERAIAKLVFWKGVWVMF
jgi:hypothetical protein